MDNNLVISSGQTLMLQWDSDSFITTSVKLDIINIIMHEARVSYDRRVEWTSEIPLASQIDNTGAVEITLPSNLPMMSDSDTAHYIVLFQLIVNTNVVNNDRYIVALKQQGNVAGIWSHVLFRKVNPGSNTELCSQWMESNNNHPATTEGVEACPCTQTQADLPMSPFAPRTTPGQKKLDAFFHEESVCYGPKRTIV